MKNVEEIIELYLKDDLKLVQTVNSPAVNQAKTVEKSNGDLKDSEGRIHNDELKTIYTARVADGRLILTHIKHGNTEFTETGKDKFSGRIEFPVEIEFVSGRNGAVAGFRVSNFGAKNVKFAKSGN